MKRVLLAAVLPVLLPMSLAGCATTSSPAAPSSSTSMVSNGMGAALDEALAGSWRDPKNVARDAYRHPKQTLSFFGVKPDQSVVEITPGAGWYSEILVPYLRDNGRYVAAVYDDKIEGQSKYRAEQNAKLRAKFSGNTEVFGSPEVRAFDPASPVFGPEGSADTVLTFRNAHNWVSADAAPAYFKAFFNVLKPGGVLGVVDHRAKPGTDLATQSKSGYLTEELVIKLAEDAGFKLEDKSEINANPKDTADHPNGVWSLPPSNRHEEADKEKYQAIGESDRMTLRFIKPRG
ncbi:MAG: methyltransferase [Cystobacter sp.]